MILPQLVGLLFKLAIMPQYNLIETPNWIDITKNQFLLILSQSFLLLTNLKIQAIYIKALKSKNILNALSQFTFKKGVHKKQILKYLEHTIPLGKKKKFVKIQ